MSKERALMGVIPFCPKCGNGAMVMKRAEVPGEIVPVKCGSQWCNWEGEGPLAIKIPLREERPTPS